MNNIIFAIICYRFDEIYSRKVKCITKFKRQCRHMRVILRRWLPCCQSMKKLRCCRLYSAWCYNLLCQNEFIYGSSLFK